MVSEINTNCYFSKGLSMMDRTCEQGRIMCCGCSAFTPKKGMKGAMKRFNHRVNKWFDTGLSDEDDGFDGWY